MENINHVPSLEEITAQSIVGDRPHNAALIKCRKEHRLTQSELATMVDYKDGVSISHIEKLEAFPDSIRAQLIANVLGVEPKQLFPEWLKLYTSDPRQPTQIKTDEVSTDRLGDKEPSVGIEKWTDQWIQEEKLVGVLKILTGREKRVMMLRSGMETGVEETLEKIAKDLKVSKARIWYIEEKAYLKLRRKLRWGKLEELKGLIIETKVSMLGEAQSLVNGAINTIYNADKRKEKEGDKIKEEDRRKAADNLITAQKLLEQQKIEELFGLVGLGVKDRVVQLIEDSNFSRLSKKKIHDYVQRYLQHNMFEPGIRDKAENIIIERQKIALLEEAIIQTIRNLGKI